MFGEFSGEEEAHGRLDFSGGDGGFFVVLSQGVGLASYALEKVPHERVHDRHRLGGDAGVGMHLKKNIKIFFPFLTQIFFNL